MRSLRLFRRALTLLLTLALCLSGFPLTFVAPPRRDASFAVIYEPAAARAAAAGGVLTAQTPLTPTFTSPLPIPEPPMTTTLPLPEPVPTSTLLLGVLQSTGVDRGWQLTYNAPHVALFSGAATFDYPLETPPGRNGLQPDLRLSYNSRRVDGVLAWIQDWVGIGWTIDTMDIVRTGVSVSPDGAVGVANRSLLLLNGAAYELWPGNGVVEGQPGRYYAKDAPQLYLEMLAGDPVGELRSTWLVRTANGTTYRLGTTLDASQFVGNYWSSFNVIYRWRLAEAEDVHGNQLQFTYHEQRSCGRDAISLPSTIRYNNYGGSNWATEITFVRSAVYPPVDVRWDFCNLLVFGDPGALERVEVRHLGELLHTYRLTIEKEPGEWSPTRDLRRLYAVQQWSGNGALALPATTFAYTNLINKEACIGCGDPHRLSTYAYPRLSTSANGFGVQTEFLYARVSEANDTNAGYDYRVQEQRTGDGMRPHPARTLYTYGAFWEKDAKVLGYDEVTVEARDYDGTTLTRSKHWFDNPKTNVHGADPLRGREYRQETYTPGNQLLQHTDTLWTARPFTGTTFAALVGVTQRDETGKATRVDYAVDAYGQTNAIFNYGFEEPVVNGGFENELTGWSTWQIAPEVHNWGLAGSRALRIANQPQNGTVYQDLSGLQPQAAYRVRVWARTQTGQPPFRLCVNNASGGNWHCAGGVAPGTDWQEFSVNYPVDQSGKLRIELQALAGTGILWIDQVAVARTEDVGDEMTTRRFLFDLTTGGRWFIGLQWAENVYAGITNHNEAWLQTQTLHYFDGYTGSIQDQTAHQAAITKGLVTISEQGQWSTGQTVRTRFAYNSWGQLTDTWDPRNTRSRITYDSTTSLYPLSQCSAFGLSIQQCTSTQYYGVNGVPADYGLPGQVKQVTDSNNVISVAYRYDALGRVERIKAPDDPGWGDGQVSTRFAYEALGQSGLQRILRRSGRDFTWQEIYFDGMGRTIQTHQQAENGQEIRTTQEYNALGQVVRAWIPYYGVHGNGNNNWGYIPPAGDVPFTRYQYDALGRVTEITHPDSTRTRTAYQGRRVATLDANGHQRVSLTDAYGRLIEVREYLGAFAAVNWNAQVYATTRYTYDVLGNLKTVTDAANNVTSMTYDVWGRKIAMTDPDMGTWTYAYDAAGNLVRQTDARNTRICFYYDPLNRLKGKTYSAGSAACPADPGYNNYAAEYWYDEGGATALAIGRRTRMVVPNVDTTTWQYDSRGRVTQESKTISGAGTFITQYQYNPLDLVTQITYPDGEVVAQSYYPQSWVHSLSGTNPYVNNATYTALGQPATLPLGNGLTTVNTYDPLSARLRRSRTGSLLDLAYDYDLVGNVRALHDVTRAESQQFIYDALDRLTGFRTASTTARTVTIRARGSAADGWPIMQLRVNGILVQQWTVASSTWADYTVQAPLTGYDQVDVVFTNDYCVPSGCANGDRNLYVDYVVVNGSTIQAESSQMTYDRGAGAIAFDGQDVIAGQEALLWNGALRTTVVTNAAAWTEREGYEYNPLGNLTFKTGMGSYTYPVSGPNSVRPHAVTSAGGRTYTYDANGNMSTHWHGGVSQNLGYNPENRLESVTRNGKTTTYGYDGNGALVKKTAYENLAAGVMATSNTTLYWPEVVTNGDTWADSGAGASGEFAYTGSTGLRYVQLDLGGVYTVDQVKVWHYAADGRTYYNTKTEVSADGTTWHTIFDSVVSGTYPETAAGKTHLFTPRAVRYVRDYLNGSTANAGNHWVEIEVWGQRTTVYVNALYEKDVTANLSTKYYYFGSQRIAMRRGNTLTYLHGDHLGSAALTTNASGARVSLMRYTPYGELRVGGLPTDRQFTGQRREASLGFYDYVARQYDPALGRFLQADTIIPDPANPQSFNRYAYVLNHPLRYTDPSGHASNDGGLEPGAHPSALVQLRREQIENYQLIHKLMRQGRLNELQDFTRFMRHIQPGSIGVLAPHGGYERIGLGNVGHAVVGAGEGVFIGTGGAKDTRGVYMSSAAAIWTDDDWHTGLSIYEVQGLNSTQRQAAAEFALDSYGAGYSYGGLVTGKRNGGFTKEWYCSELAVAALEQADVTFYTLAVSLPFGAEIHRELRAPTLPLYIPGYRTIVDGGWWLTTTPLGSSMPLMKTWP